MHGCLVYTTMHDPTETGKLLCAHLTAIQLECVELQILVIQTRMWFPKHEIY